MTDPDTFNREAFPEVSLRGHQVKIEKKLGSGKYGEVWLARHPDYAGEFALKGLKTEEAASLEWLKLQEEIRANTESADPENVHLVTFYEYFEYNGRPFILMEYCALGSLEEKYLGPALRPGRPPLGADQVIDYMIQLCQGLSFAHKRGIVHGDIKPANLLLAQSQHGPLLKIGDFGQARVPGKFYGSSLSLRGDHRFTAPERLRDGTTTLASDVFSIGATMYKLLTGLDYFSSGQDQDQDDERDKNETVRLITSGRFQPVPPHHLDRVGSLVKIGASRVAIRALDPNPRKRYRSAGEMLKALKSVRKGHVPGPARNRTILYGLPVVLVFGVFLVVWMLLASSSSPSAGALNSRASSSASVQNAGQASPGLTASLAFASPTTAPEPSLPAQPTRASEGETLTAGPASAPPTLPQSVAVTPSVASALPGITQPAGTTPAGNALNSPPLAGSRTAGPEATSPTTGGPARNALNLIKNGDLSQPWSTGWARKVGSSANGANNVTIEPQWSSNLPGNGPALHLEHSGLDILSVYQDIPVTNLKLRFSARVEGSYQKIGRFLTSYSSFATVSVEYLGEGDKILASTNFVVNDPQVKYGDTPDGHNHRLSPNTPTTIIIDNLAEEIQNYLPAISDQKAVKALRIVLSVGVVKPDDCKATEGEAQLYASGFELTPLT